MAEFFDYDPMTGIRTDINPKENGEVEVIRKADLSDIKAYATRQRLEGVRDNKREAWQHYAYIPPIVMAEMMQAGIDVSRDQEAVFRYINEHYPALKTTEKWHDSRKAGKVHV